VVLAVNKMDLVDYSAERFEAIRREYRFFAAGLGFEEIAAIPISALEGDNVLQKSVRTPWYEGPALMEYLEGVQIEDAAATRSFRLPVQWVNRPHLDFRGFSGTIVSGTIHPGDPVVVSSSGQTSKVARIVTMDGDLQEAVAGQAVTLTLEDEIDVSRGDLLAAPEQRPEQGDQLEAHIVWLHEQPLAAGGSYLLKTAAGSAPAQVRHVSHKINVNTLRQEPGASLALNEVGVCRIAVSKSVAFDAYRDNRATGSFILIDRFTNATVAAGMVDRAVVENRFCPWQERNVDKAARAELKGQQPKVLWISGGGDQPQVSLARLLEKKLYSLGRHTCLLDGELLGKAFGDTQQRDIPEDQLRRLVGIARTLTDAGLIVVVPATASIADVAPWAEQLFDEGELIEYRVEEDGETAEKLAEEIAEELFA
jgi:bifunctional enzyme CysN/CysC